MTELSTLAAQINGRNIGYAAEVFAAVALLYFLVCAAIESSAALLLVLGRYRRHQILTRAGVAQAWPASVQRNP